MVFSTCHEGKGTASGMDDSNVGSRSSEKRRSWRGVVVIKRIGGGGDLDIHCTTN